MTPQDVVAAVPARITAHRVAQCFTMVQLAEKAGVHYDGLRKVEAGQRVPTLPTLAAIATALKIPLAELLEDV